MRSSGTKLYSNLWRPIVHLSSASAARTQTSAQQDQRKVRLAAVALQLYNEKKDLMRQIRIASSLTIAAGTTTQGLPNAAAPVASETFKSFTAVSPKGETEAEAARGEFIA